MSILKGNLSSDYLNGEFQKSLKDEEKILDRTSGFKRLDECQIMSPGLYLISGESGSGKSTFVGQLVEQMLDNNPHECVIYVTYDLTEEDVYYKSLTRYIYQSNPQKAIKESQLQNHADDPVLLDAAAQLGDRSPLMFVMEFPGEKEQLFEQLYKAINEFKEIDPLIYSPIVVIDPIQGVPYKDNISEKNNVYQILYMITEFQHKTNSTVFVVSYQDDNNPFEDAATVEWVVRCKTDNSRHSTFVLKNKKARGGIEGYTLHYDYYYTYNTFVEKAEED